MRSRVAMLIRNQGLLWRGDEMRCRNQGLLCLRCTSDTVIRSIFTTEMRSFTTFTTEMRPFSTFTSGTETSGTDTRAVLERNTGCIEGSKTVTETTDGLHIDREPPNTVILCDGDTPQVKNPPYCI